MFSKKHDFNKRPIKAWVILSYLQEKNNISKTKITTVPKFASLWDKQRINEQKINLQSI